ncbi:MAG: SLC13 family permease [Acidobacteriota bacterium]
MNPALASMLALILAIVLSMTSRINVGIVSIALASLIGVFIAGMKVEAVLAGFPAGLFLTLTGVTLLFACADLNGTLEQMAHRIVGLARGSRRALPLLFFMIALVISSVGPGAISSVALVIPVAMMIGKRARLPNFLTALMVANGANAGNLSPISSVGIIANTKMEEAGVGYHPGKVWFANLVAHAIIAGLAYLLLGGHRLTGSEDAGTVAEERRKLNRDQIWTVAVIAVWIVSVILLKVSPGPGAFAAAALLIAVGVTDEQLAIRKVPWGIILMVCGVTVLIALLEKTGGMDLFSGYLARLARPWTINGLIALITGAISTYSSTSGVVLPAFLPIIPGLIGKLGGGDALAIALSVNIGSALVDVSPLSTLGAMCVAAVTEPMDSQQLFRSLMIWGLSMVIFGALFCQAFAGLIAHLW